MRFIFNKDLTLEMVPDPDKHSWESDMFGHGWRAFAITINGYTRDPFEKSVKVSTAPCRLPKP